jgi:hypothetical protein
MEMARLEKAALKRIKAAETKSKKATAEFKRNPTMLGYFENEELLTAFYKELKLQADEMNDFISNNQHVGYIFRKECS